METRAAGAAAQYASQPSSAWGSLPALPPELASLFSVGDVRAVSPERDEPFPPDAAEAKKGSPLARLNAAVASLELGGFEAHGKPASDRQPRDGAAGPAVAGERQDAPRPGLGAAEVTPRSAGEPRDAFAARSAAAAASLPASPAGLVLPVAAAPVAIAEALAANLPAAARPTGPLLVHFSRPGESARILTLELKPDTLGSVTARLKLEETKLAVEITVTTAEARDRLGPDGGEIARALEALGLSVDRVTVSLDETRSSREGAAPRGAGEDRLAASGDQTGRGEGGGRPRHEDGAGRTGGGLGRGSERIEAGHALPTGSVYI